MNNITIVAIIYSVIALAVSATYFFYYRAVLKSSPVQRALTNRINLGPDITINGLLWPLLLVRLALYFLGVAIAGPED
jgi:hypothetical protein